MKIIRVIRVNNPFSWYNVNDYYNVKDFEEYNKIYYIVVGGSQKGKKIRKEDCAVILDKEYNIKGEII